MKRLAVVVAPQISVFWQWYWQKVGNVPHWTTFNTMSSNLLSWLHSTFIQLLHILLLLSTKFPNNFPNKSYKQIKNPHLAPQQENLLPKIVALATFHRNLYRAPFFRLFGGEGWPEGPKMLFFWVITTTSWVFFSLNHFETYADRQIGNHLFPHFSGIKLRNSWFATN